MRIFFDTEFNEDGKTIELISIGLVREDGASYYAVSEEFNPLTVNPWVKANVLPHLPPRDSSEWKPRAQIRDEVYAFVCEGQQTAPEIWAYYADYDWVAFCQLWGRMVDLPPMMPKWCRDLKQLMDMCGVSFRDVPEQAEDTKHDALADARWNLSTFQWIQRYVLTHGQVRSPRV